MATVPIIAVPALAASLPHHFAGTQSTASRCGKPENDLWVKISSLRAGDSAGAPAFRLWRGAIKEQMMGMYDCINREPEFISSGDSNCCFAGNCIEKATVVVPLIFADIKVCKQHYESMGQLFTEFSEKIGDLHYHYFFHSGLSFDSSGWGSTVPNQKRSSDFCEWHICRKSNGFEGANGEWHGAKLMLVPTIFGCFKICDEHHIKLREELHELAKSFADLKDDLMFRIRRIK